MDGLATLYRETGTVSARDCTTPAIGEIYPIDGPYQHDGGFGWVIALPGFASYADGPDRSLGLLRVLENGRPLPWAKRNHAEIRDLGRGRYSHWGQGLYFSSSDNSDPNTNGRAYAVQLVTPEVEERIDPVGALRRRVLLDLPPPFIHEGGHSWTVFVHALAHLTATSSNQFSPVVLLEDGVPLPFPNSLHEDIRHDGAGRYSYWHQQLHFAASDNTDPNTNGRTYQIGFDVHESSRPGQVIYRKADGFHLERDGVEIQMPRYCNIGVTNKCNLRCAICGSQKYIDMERIPRRFMDINVFHRVAETVFPFMAEVEISSYGEPSLHPQFPEMIETINRHGCVLKLQTNATLLIGRLIDHLAQAKGVVWMSIDAVGPLFNEARAHGNWEAVDRGVRALMARRDPRRLKVGINPTVTRRTLPDMLNVLRWAYENGIDCVNYRRYDPVSLSPEERPTSDEMAPHIAELSAWLAEHPDGPDVKVDTEWLRFTYREFIDETMYKVPRTQYPNYPVPRSHELSHREYLCMAPMQYIEVGLDGEIYACCRAQRSILGAAGSLDEFVDTWLGVRYRALRQSLRHDGLNPVILQECAGCVRTYAGPS